MNEQTQVQKAPSMVSDNPSGKPFHEDGNAPFWTHTIKTASSGISYWEVEQLSHHKHPEREKDRHD